MARPEQEIGSPAIERKKHHKSKNRSRSDASHGHSRGGGTRRRNVHPRRVEFNPDKDEYHQIENLNKFTRREKENLWWHHEYVEECIDEGVAFMMDFENYYYDHEDDEYHFDYDSCSSNSSFCARGFENLLPQRAEALEQRRTNVWNAVISELQDQWREGREDPLAIAAAARQSTHAFVVQMARIKGMLDEQKAMEIHAGVSKKSRDSPPTTSIKLKTKRRKSKEATRRSKSGRKSGGSYFKRVIKSLSRGPSYYRRSNKQKIPSAPKSPARARRRLPSSLASLNSSTHDDKKDVSKRKKGSFFPPAKISLFTGGNSDVDTDNETKGKERKAKGKILTSEKSESRAIDRPASVPPRTDPSSSRTQRSSSSSSAGAPASAPAKLEKDELVNGTTGDKPPTKIALMTSAGSPKITAKKQRDKRKAPKKTHSMESQCSSLSKGSSVTSCIRKRMLTPVRSIQRNTSAQSASSGAASKGPKRKASIKSTQSSPPTRVASRKASIKSTASAPPTTTAQKATNGKVDQSSQAGPTALESKGSEDPNDLPRNILTKSRKKKQKRSRSRSASRSTSKKKRRHKEGKTLNRKSSQSSLSSIGSSVSALHPRNVTLPGRLRRRDSNASSPTGAASQSAPLSRGDSKLSVEKEPSRLLASKMANWKGNMDKQDTKRFSITKTVDGSDDKGDIRESRSFFRKMLSASSQSSLFSGGSPMSTLRTRNKVSTSSTPPPQSSSDVVDPKSGSENNLSPESSEDEKAKKKRKEREKLSNESSRSKRTTSPLAIPRRVSITKTGDGDSPVAKDGKFASVSRRQSERSIDLQAKSERILATKRGREERKKRKESKNNSTKANTQSSTMGSSTPAASSKSTMDIPSEKRACETSSQTMEAQSKKAGSRKSSHSSQKVDVEKIIDRAIEIHKAQKESMERNNSSRINEGSEERKKKIAKSPSQGSLLSIGSSISLARKNIANSFARTSSKNLSREPGHGANDETGDQPSQSLPTYSPISTTRKNEADADEKNPGNVSSSCDAQQDDSKKRKESSKKRDKKIKKGSRRARSKSRKPVQLDTQDVATARRYPQAA